MSARDDRRVTALVRRTITEATEIGPFRDALLTLLGRPGRVLAPGGVAKWPAFVFGLCRALGGAPAAAIDAAVAVEFVAAAADVVDDLVDDEWDLAALPWRRALNASHALPWLAQRRAAALGAVLGSARADLIGAILARGYLAAAAGEDIDLALGALPDASEEAAHDMTRRKSGSLVAMACQVGAATAAEEPTILEVAGRLGMHIGIVSQLLNDLAGVDPARIGLGSDLALRKKTLPVTYALRCAREEGLVELTDWAASAGALAPGEDRRLATAILQLGGAHYTWVVAAVHRREALVAARELANLAGGRGAERQLRRLIPAVPLRAGDTAG